jgi:hypothetical protein
MSINTRPADDRTDIREYSDAELSLICYNDEDLYKQMRRTHGIESRVRAIVDDLFIYNDEQLEDLITTIDEDLAEDAN